MGKVEKIIVLSVLMLVTVILVVALNTSESPGALPGEDVRNGNDLIAGQAGADESGRETAQDARIMSPGRVDPEPRILFGDPNEVLPPLADAGSTDPDGDLMAGHLSSGSPADSSIGQPEEASIMTEPTNTASDPVEGHLARNDSDDPAGSSSGLLSSNVNTAEPEPQPEPERPAEQVPVGPQGSILVKLLGLEDSGLPDFKFYTCTDGDTFRGVAARYYGDRRRVGLLKHANEGVSELAEGVKIWVPVYDLENPVKQGEEPGTGAATYYTVADGDSLWTIAKEKLGAGSRWKEIFEANRDLMKNENSLSLGMRLRIP